MAGAAVTHITDPGCPFAYSAEPSITALRWRYGDQLDWRTVMIGLAERPEEYERRGYTALWMTQAWLAFRRHGMPFTTEVRPRVLATGTACRALVALRLDAPALVPAALRALRLAWFTTTLMLDQPDGLERALQAVPGLDARAVLDRLGDADVEDAYWDDRELARSAAGSPAAAQGKTASTDGPERYTAPTLIFERDTGPLVAGGFQPLEAYDLLLVNAAPDLERRGPAETVREALSEFPEGLTTREAALLRAPEGSDPDDLAAAAELIELAHRGRARQLQMGSGVLWLPSRARRFAGEGVRTETEVPA